MTDQTKSAARPHRLSLNVKLGVVFMLLALLGSASLYLLNILRDSTLDIAGIISQSAQLRHLSQEVALHACGFVPERSEAARQSLRDAQAS